jgi:hypothetical protein
MVLLLPVMAQAGDWNGIATLGYSHTSVSGGGGDANAGTLDVNGVYDFGNGVSLGFDTGFSSVDVSSVAVNSTENYYALNGAYKLDSGMTFGAYVEHQHLDSSTGLVLLGSGSITSYGATIGYETAALNSEVYFGASETDPSMPAGVDIRDYGLRVSYQISAQGFIAGTLARTRISGPGGDTNLDRIALGGGYAFTDQFSAFGGIDRLKANAFGTVKLTAYSLGVGYRPANLSSVPMIFSLEVQRTHADSSFGGTSNADTIRAGVSIPLGQGKAGVPANSLLNGIGRGPHSVAVGNRRLLF